MKRKFFSIEHKTFADLGVANYKELWEKAKADGFDGLSISVKTVFTKSDQNGKKLFHAVFSSSNEDRHGDIVQQVFDLAAFQKNPVYLDSHNYDSIEHIIGRIPNIGVTEGKLQGDIEFATVNPKGALAEQMAEQGFLNTNSIGFIPKVFDDQGHILESELLEISAVSVPANADAVFVRSKSADAEPEKPAPAPEPAPAPAPEPAPAAAKTVNRTAIAVKVTGDMLTDRKRMLHSIAKNVQELTDENKVEKKRKIYQAVRTLLAQDH
jgi:hypothetical protein